MALTGCSTCINVSGFTRKLLEKGFGRRAFWGNSFHKTLLKGESYFYKKGKSTLV